MTSEMLLAPPNRRSITAGVFFVVVLLVLPAGAFSRQNPDSQRESGSSNSGARPEPDQLIVYKNTPQGELKFHVFKPGDWNRADRRGAIVFFFGGGWVGGSPKQLYWHCSQLSDKGMIAISAEYRVKRRHGTSPFICIEDAKSAVRYIREHAEALGVDPNRVAAGGASAGGHIAVCTAVIRAFDAENSPERAASVPNLVVAFNPVLDTGPKGFGYKKLKERYREISPVEHVRAGQPPMLIFHGTADTTVPFDNAQRFSDLMQMAGNDCQLFPFKGMNHGFFNYGRHENEPYIETMKLAEQFLGRHGFFVNKITPRPSIEKESE